MTWTVDASGEGQICAVIAGQERIGWLWRKHRPRTIAVLTKRPRYRNNKPDMADSVVILIGGTPADETKLEHWDNRLAFDH